MTRYRRALLKLTLFSTFFVAIAALAAFLLRSTTHTSSTGDRAPSSVVYNEDGEPVFWDQSLEEIEQSSVNDSSFGGTVLPPPKSYSIFTNLGELSSGEAERKTGITARRARLVRFNLENFKTAVTHMGKSGQRYVSFPLFHDVNLALRLERPSSYSVNTGVYWGQVHGDDASTVRLFVDGLHMNATIVTKGRTFRIMTTGGSGPEHIVLEETPTIR